MLARSAGLLSVRVVRTARMGHLPVSLLRMPTAAPPAPAADSVHAAPRVVGYWLLGTAGMVYGMIVLGGYTRLTRSGLSMVDWSPQGSLPPSSREAWEEEFAKYKQFPEYKRMNMHMTLEEFKSIFYTEWLHRTVGRALGLVFAGPLLYFAARRMIPRAMYGRLGGALLLGGAQGAVGWWMVKSGLQEAPDSFKEPRVSPYRLAVHLSFAMSIYSLLLWTALDVLRGPPRMPAITDAHAPLLPRMLRLRRAGLAAWAVLGVTVLSGAFVAGNDAGHAFNDFPFFAGRWLPEGMWDQRVQPAWRNWFENDGLVQLDHRVLAFSTLAATAALFAAARRPAGMWRALPRDVQKALHSVVGMAGVQVALGIATLMLYVPVHLGVTHQGGAVALWSFVLLLLHTLRFARTPAFARALAAVATKAQPRLP